MSDAKTVLTEIVPNIDSVKDGRAIYYGFVYVSSDGSSGPATRMVFASEGTELAVYRAQGWKNPSRRQIADVLDALRPEAEARGLTI